MFIIQKASTASVTSTVPADVVIDACVMITSICSLHSDCVVDYYCQLVCLVLSVYMFVLHSVHKVLLVIVMMGTLHLRCPYNADTVARWLFGFTGELFAMWPVGLC